jgi:hypothetical protein
MRVLDGDCVCASLRCVAVRGVGLRCVADTEQHHLAAADGARIRVLRGRFERRVSVDGAAVGEHPHRRSRSLLMGGPNTAAGQ